MAQPADWRPWECPAPSTGGATGACACSQVRETASGTSSLWPGSAHKPVTEAWRSWELVDRAKWTARFLSGPPGIHAMCLAVMVNSSATDSSFVQHLVVELRVTCLWCKRGNVHPLLHAPPTIANLKIGRSGALVDKHAVLVNRSALGRSRSSGEKEALAAMAVCMSTRTAPLARHATSRTADGATGKHGVRVLSHAMEANRLEYASSTLMPLATACHALSRTQRRLRHATPANVGLSNARTLS